LSSTFARSKQIYSTKIKRWDNLAWFTFIIGYAFLINVVGILISLYVGLLFGTIFFIVNIILTSIYSIIYCSPNKKIIIKRLFRDLFFIVLIIVLGFLPSLGVF